MTSTYIIIFYHFLNDICLSYLKFNEIYINAQINPREFPFKNGK